MTRLVECRDLKKSFGRKEAVRGIDLDIEEGDVFGLLGPNGAGKSTLIKMMTGLIWPDDGCVSIKGHDVHENHVKALQNVGAIIEWPAFIPYLTARENLYMLSGGQGKDFEKKLDEVVDFVNMKGNLDRKINGFSTGMKQRMGIALALLPDSHFVILDEPTNGLDPNGIAEVRDIIKQRNEQFGTTIVLSSHLLGEIECICNKIAIVHNGVIVASGKIEDLLRGKYSIRIKADKIQQAFDIICENYVGNRIMADSISNEGREIRIDVEDDFAAEINTLLVTKGIAVSHISCDHQTLEQFFMNITDGQTDV